MNFRFKLETVLKHVKMKEDKIQQEFSLITLRHTEALNELEELKDKVLREHNCLELNYNLVFIKEAYVDRLKNEVDSQAQVVMRLNVEKIECQKRVIEAVKERKILEKLKEKHKEEFISQMTLAEQKALDEQALNTFQRGII